LGADTYIRAIALIYLVRESLKNACQSIFLYTEVVVCLVSIVDLAATVSAAAGFLLAVLLLFSLGTWRSM
jgi:hypothetical protein